MEEVDVCVMEFQRYIWVNSTWPSPFKNSHDNKDAVIDRCRLLSGVGCC